MKAFIVLACFFVAAQAYTWESFKSTHGKSYSSVAEEAMRRTIYEENLKKIEQHNERFARGEVTHTMGMNQFGDLSNKEFIKMMNGFKGKNTTKNALHKVMGNAPASVDWRENGAVTGVKDQGQCGSCWSFSTTGSIEGQYFLKNKKLVSFSEQQLVDCSSQYGNYGCDGGDVDSAFEYIIAQGLEGEDSYPYTAEDGSCAYVSGSSILKTISSFVNVASEDENALLDAVANVGPISVSIDASRQSFQFYSGGVYSEPHCSSCALDHSVLAVGYGSENGQDYWLVKNSWGETWGLSGYIKMTRNNGNQCGIATQASYPVM